MIETLDDKKEWWSSLEPQWKKAYNEAFFDKSPTEEMPDDAHLEELFSCPNFRFAGPRSFHPNMSFELTNLSGLSGMGQAELISVTNHQITDIAPIKLLDGVTSLFLNDNAIDNIDALENMVEMTTLFISNNQIKSLQPLEKMVNLESLNCGLNKLSTFEGLNPANTQNLENFVGLPNRVAQTEIDRLQNDLRVRVHSI